MPQWNRTLQLKPKPLRYTNAVCTEFSNIVVAFEFPSQTQRDNFKKIGVVAWLAGFESTDEWKNFNFILSDGQRTSFSLDNLWRNLKPC